MGHLPLFLLDGSLGGRDVVLDLTELSTRGVVLLAEGGHLVLGRRQAGGDGCGLRPRAGHAVRSDRRGS